MTNAEWIIKSGYKFADVHYSYVANMDTGEIEQNFYIAREGKKGKVNIATLKYGIPEYGGVGSDIKLLKIGKFLDLEYSGGVLDDAERHYIFTVIRPFKEQVECIRKVVSKSNKNKASIRGYGCGGVKVFQLAEFPTDKMYLRMEDRKRYSLEDLGLD